MGTTLRWPLAVACLALALAPACAGDQDGAPPARAATSTATGAGSPGGAATTGPSPAATGRTAASPHWKLFAGARLGGAAALLDVAASGPRDAWAVGYKDGAEDSEGRPALQHWDGTRWTETPEGAGDAGRLLGVSAAGARDVWVVGAGDSPYAAHWDGTRWTPRHPYGVAEEYVLSDVAAHGGHAWLAGRNTTQGVITEWTGRGFRNALRADGYFTAVTATTGHVWAVGNDAAAPDAQGGPMIWHGSAVSGTAIQSWQRARTPAIPGGVLRGVWTAGPDDVWAVGAVTAPGGGPRTPRTPLVLHWDGLAWRSVEVPVPGGALDGVTGSGPGDVWISGVDADHSGQALFLHFDGTGWSRSYGPLVREHREGQQYEESDDVRRTGIARVPGAGGLWAVGSVGAGDEEDDFILRHR
ncbi:hypothetical protein [Sphaerisporangium rhizosphaerae]|uniref:Uncharacterized protein n=1 Tax=Sphaerisporangium rhizosphaerae TaxID=2269375 RepID=A0ABW2P974_9ACTN